MNYKEFAQKVGLPEDLKKADKTVASGFMSICHYPPEQHPYIRLITLSKDLYIGLGKLTDESRARFLTGLYLEAKEAQSTGEIFTLDVNDEGRAQMLVTLVENPNEHILHVEQR